MIPASLVHQGRKKKQAQYPATHSASPSRVTTLLHPLPSTFPAAFTATPAAPQLRLLPSEPARMQQEAPTPTRRMKQDIIWKKNHRSESCETTLDLHITMF
ncbi:unnamed protein product [Lactuca virosa]|uniref:Uncharacterized protein n=1 Tax=Lactuca virosa TaxID=75947 RepID=A0AAU9NRR2_9ASTR|nr:unnamed protein product [Lactuca virosa]